MEGLIILLIIIVGILVWGLYFKKDAVTVGEPS
jgi:hypothetical protein